MNTFGKYIACVEAGIAPHVLPQMEGAAAVLQGEKMASAGRLIAKAAYDVMQVCGRGNEAPAFHLRFIAKSADWNTHYQEVVDHVVRTLKVLEPLQKQASIVPDVVSGLGLAGRTALYGSLGAGAGLGSLYWLLSRHANQDDSDIEAMNRQVHYYDQLSKELSDSMKRKYHYDRKQQPAAA